MIYLNNAATTLQKPPCVAQAVVEAMSHLGNGARGGHTGELSAARTVFQPGRPWPDSWASLTRSGSSSPPTPPRL